MNQVFKFKAMPMVAETRRTRRGLVPGGRTKPKEQMVEIQRIYKGEKMMMPMMKLKRASALIDSFSAATKIEASLQLNLNKKEFKGNQKCVFFGKLRRYNDGTMMPASKQRMMAGDGNTIEESTITKIMKRGLRRKYAKGCKQGCQVETAFWAKNEKSKTHCYWNINEYARHQIDCRRTTQFCYRAKNGFCEWKETSEYRKCVQKNKMP
ncbi:uncharacterized protein LOC114516276 isoform X2 [Dendronephthya gigantea]|uniref:uncharacterized protein LOC114516276 isoform X2 n=1 Tax=Dendronephthya gigantea TaxID=151771 RepID=UPI001069D1CC|nr:uncharacterized protein LOC114516276 isoform X2 [Dendronephthya gigantea]